MRYLKEKLWKPQPAPRYSLCIILSSQIDGCNDGMSVIGFFDWDPNSKVSSLTRFTSIPRPQHQMPQMRLDARSCRFWHLNVNIIREKHTYQKIFLSRTYKAHFRANSNTMIWNDPAKRSILSHFKCFAKFYRTSSVTKHNCANRILVAM